MSNSLIYVTATNLYLVDALMTARWEHFPHEADMGIRGFGCTEAEAFEEAALAMTAVVADLETIEPREVVSARHLTPSCCLRNGCTVRQTRWARSAAAIITSKCRK